MESHNSVYCLPVSTEMVTLDETNVVGGLDSIFCYTTLAIHRLEADCGGDDPKVTCSCCTKCCPGGARFCPRDIHHLCKNYAADWQIDMFQGTGTCTCAGDGMSFSCTFGGYQTRTDPSTVCGMMIAYEFLFARNGFYVSSKSSFQYTRGRDSSVVSWEAFSDGTCKVYVNGSKRDSCMSGFHCEDRFNGIKIDCSNILDIEDGPTDYRSCFPEEGGVLDVFGWIDRESLTECPLISLKEIIV